jgi:leucyl-tRNA synthetase
LLKGAPSIDKVGKLPDELAKLRREVHLNLKQASSDLARHQFNTVASAGMKLLNALERAPADGGDARAAVLAEGFSVLLRFLSPITPHITQELWVELGFGNDILTAAWPVVDEAALVQDELELVLQINGKHRGSITVAATADKAAIEALAIASEAAQKQLNGAAPKKVIVVPGRLVNIVC